MRVVLRTGVAFTALAMAMSSASAADQFIHVTDTKNLASAFSGWVEGRYGAIDEINGADGNGQTEDVDGSRWSLRGTANLRGGSFNLQVELENVNLDGGLLETRTSAGTAHAYYRPLGGNYAAGAYLRGSYEDYTNFRDAGLPEYDATDVVAGIEAAYIGQLATLYVRTGGGIRTDEFLDTELDSDRVHFGLGANLYIGDNFRVGFHGTYDQAKNDLFDVETFTFDSRATYRFDQKPISLFAGYRYDRTETHVFADEEETDTRLGELYAGAKLHFGSDSLRQEDRSGALWDTHFARQ